ncbi:MAG: 2Fe-2S iron-sulfur cluster-binding protein [Gordonia sp. (in: high G+C Gram-positive bacteria)]|uniref:2Fe-2S iron-sulfur cluster-binding protein n=1 Tax=Gordonia sp. (in: high G+C Gram-positive bacteria) TaxID=84139 RepID=UPI003C724AA0
MSVRHRVQVSGSVSASVECADDQRLLDAFLRNNVYLPNSCNQGTCGTCRVKVTCGSVSAPTVDDDVLTPELQAEGYVLACQSTPDSDVTIEAPTESSAPRHRLRDLTGTVSEIRALARDTVAVFVDVTEPLDFSAGQYMEITVPGAGLSRPYSMANPPSTDSTLEFHVRRVAGGTATDRWIFDSLSSGNRVDLRGPWGDFVHDLETTGPMILLAGGTGLAPLKSIALEALSLDPEREVHLYHGVRYADDLYESDFWRSIGVAHPGFRYQPCVSRETGVGRPGYVGDAVADDFATLRGAVAYVCGPPAMVDGAIKACRRRRMSARHIHREKYTPATELASVEG